MQTKVLIPVDDSPHSRIAVDLAFCYGCITPSAEVHLCAVLHPTTAAYPVTPMVPMASSAAIASVQHNVAQQQAVEKEKAQETLQLAKELLMLDYKVPENSVHTHLLPATGGASGVSDSIVVFANERSMDLVVVGSRGMGAIKRSMMSMIGLGSVSDAVMRNCHSPILLVRNQADKMPHPVGAQAIPKKLCVAYDESPQAQKALRWALDNMLAPHDELHIATVAIPMPYPVLDEPATAAAMEANLVQNEIDCAKQYASRILEDAMQAAVLQGVPQSQIKAS
ncbi:hypothetical protein DUNSADRAFT_7526 [Dunaliella salina]|uniref:UspA domain-containing protein n=1 Tax=Dunaliella salina TaxID=3046 RepID=A0ABQ7GL68_DUNSA|nr:hypothetical protein DUNSADRAFT_7526 [Dunaliella salina]|eukprot:KAF5835360.1 hypothetical protein DUNSADRAFT_7526 [Dunaliella salina]